MCLTKAGVRKLAHWNWEGDRIVHECIVPASRPVPGARKRGSYDIDVREFLVSERNEIMRRTLDEDIRAFAAKLPGARWDLFLSRDEGAFDHRVDVISAFVSQTIQYAYSPRNDAWQFPDETLFTKEGDCEDRALLIASLLLASGVSGYNVRVALGKVVMRGTNRRRDERDHVWVMYKNEAGRWAVIEPLHAKHIRSGGLPRKLAFRPMQAEYVPSFLFNDSHLWQVVSAESHKLCTRVELHHNWSQMHPSFAGAVHKSILDDALSVPQCPAWVLSSLNRHFSAAVLGVGPTIDDVDRDIAGYDPRDHFDNGYIKEGWEVVAQRLDAFQTTRNLDLFAKAAHGIADFYAHSSYMHFAAFEGDAPALYDPGGRASDMFRAKPNYSSGSTFDLTRGEFSVNTTYWHDTDEAHEEAADEWNGRIISGRYAQLHDTKPGLLNHLVTEGRTWIPKVLVDADDFYTRGGLPHHNEIAVDEDGRSSEHLLYAQESDDPSLVYASQFKWREGAATRHIRQAFLEHWKTA